MEVFPFKRGDTLKLNCTTDTPITGFTIDSQIRNAMGNLIDTLVVTISQTTPTGVFLCTPSTGTSTWPVGELFCDIQYTNPFGDKVSTETFIIDLIRDETWV